MSRYLIISFVGGALFGIMDFLINANAYAKRLFEAYKPIARTSINVPAGMIIDLVYGFVMAGLFLLLYKSLPGTTGYTKGLSFGVMAWFFRVAMSAASSWMMYNIPASALVYSLVVGLVEMSVLGILFGLTLRP
ncbi:hypothetical protein AMJ57_05460 [Parcubacteria bacterium SG8_24]|nr:MAG: hypothetical protein AMJ57_05460 [Parcubacteria bacterium SG8_24]